MLRSINGAAAPSGRRALALWTVLAAQLMLQMDFLIVIVALPRIQQDLGFGLDALRMEARLQVAPQHVARFMALAA